MYAAVNWLVAWQSKKETLILNIDLIKNKKKPRVKKKQFHDIFFIFYLFSRVTSGEIIKMHLKDTRFVHTFSNFFLILLQIP